MSLITPSDRDIFLIRPKFVLLPLPGIQAAGSRINDPGPGAGSMIQGREQDQRHRKGVGPTTQNRSRINDTEKEQDQRLNYTEQKQDQLQNQLHRAGAGTTTQREQDQPTK